jgi:hypothetical protein
MGTIPEKPRLVGLYSHSVSHFICRQCLFFKRMEGRGSKCLQIKACDGIGIAPSARCEDRKRVGRKPGHMFVLTLSVVSNFLLPLGSALAESSTENATQHKSSASSHTPCSLPLLHRKQCSFPVARCPLLSCHSTGIPMPLLVWQREMLCLSVVTWHRCGL